MRTSLAILYVFTLLLCALFWGCKDEVDLSFDADVSLSADTLRFDTVFSGERSSTMTLMVRNHSKKSIRIERVFLEGGSGSSFRFNIDGIANGANDVSGIEIGGKDSVYVFVDVLVNETDNNAPFLVSDRLHLLINSKDYSVVTESYGQNVIRFSDKIIRQDSTLTAERPFLVNGYLAVDSTCTLTIEAGTRIYFRSGSQMIVFGSLNANGTLDAPIVLCGDRLDNLFEHVPYSMTSGQWQGLYLNHGKGLHNLNYVELRGASNGIFSSSWSRNEVQTVEMHNCLIHNNAGIGFAAINSNVTATNCEISNSSEYCVYLAGGEHNFIHCTIANYYGNTNVNIHQTHRGNVPAVCINDIPKTANMLTNFVNCIVSGTQQNEWSLLSYFEESYPLTVSHSYLRCDSIEDLRYTETQHWHWGDKLFINDYYRLGEYKDYDFNLCASSRARDIGDATVASKYPLDRNGRSRTADGKPDAGCYEFNEENEDEH